MLATAPTTAAALPVLPPADIAWTYKTNQTLGETIGRAGREPCLRLSWVVLVLRQERTSPGLRKR
jgi:hypothetical protein